jgi:hypothetical protein
MNSGYCKKISINSVGSCPKNSVNNSQFIEDDIISFNSFCEENTEKNLFCEEIIENNFGYSHIFINKEESWEVPPSEINNDFSNNSKANTNYSRKPVSDININKEENNFPCLNTTPYINITNASKQEQSATNKTNNNSKIIFKSINKEIINSFKIFHPGYIVQYPRELINSISDKKICVNIYQRSKQKKDRKYYADDMRKKIKARFLKDLKNAVNEKLKYAKAKVLFSYLPQNFVKNPNKNINKEVLDMTFKEVFTNNFDNIKENKTKSYLRYSQYNTSVINYLEENEVVGEKSNYNSYKNMKYKEIYDEYLNSREFEENINKIINDESEEYAKKYIELALHLNDFFIMDCKEI